MTTQDSLINRITSLFPYILLIVAGAGIFIDIFLHRTDIAIASLIWIIPLVLAALILLLSKHNSGIGLALPSFTSSIKFRHLFLLNVFIFIISLIILISFATRPFEYFIVVSLASGVLFLQVLCKRPGWTDGLIIAELIILSLNLIWGVALKYPLYFADTDSMGHMYIIDVIMNTAHTGSLIPGYEKFQMYHILNAIGVELTGMLLRTALYLVMGIAWQTGTVFAYLIFKKLSNSSNFSLIAAMLFALSSPIIFYGSYAIARSLSVVLFMSLLYLILDNYQKQSKFIFLTIIVMCTLIMTHHLTVLFIIPVLVCIFFFQKVAIRLGQDNTVISATFILLFAICTVAYLIWISFNMMETTLPRTVRTILELDIEIKADPLRGYGAEAVLGIAYYAFILLLCLLGIRRILDCYRSNSSSKNAYIFAVAGIIMLAVYMPGPLDLFPQSQVVLIRRLNLLVSPFIACLAAYGTEYLTSLQSDFKEGIAKSLYVPFLAIVLIVPITFFSFIGTGNAQDTDYFPHIVIADTPYFTDEELTSFSFINENADTAVPLYSDYQTKRNLLAMRNLAFVNIIKGPDISYIQNGYLLLRVGELQRRGVLTFNDAERRNYRYRVDSSNPESDIRLSLLPEDKIYCSDKVQTYILHNDIMTLKQ